MRFPEVLLILTFYVRSTHHEAFVPPPTPPPQNDRNFTNNGSGANNISGEGDFAKRGYGEPCTCDLDCNFGRWLICQNGYCNCAKKSFVFDYTRQTCVVRLSEKCFEIAQEYIDYNPKDLPPTIRCVEGAFCSMSAGGVCACNTYGYYQSLDGTTCQRKKNYGQPCTRGLECKSDVCSGPDGKCICNIGEFYHKRRKRCVSLVGAICFGDDDCLDNGVCLEHLAVCGCSEDYLETQSKTCEMRLSYGDSCTEANPCNNPELACIDSMCVCKYSNHQQFENDTGHCLSFPGGPCVEDQNCVKNSKCEQGQNNMFQECRCEEGHLEMPNGQCERFSGQGEACQFSSECDPLPPLVCLEGSCDCRDFLTKYELETRSCRGLVGSRCSQDRDCTRGALCSQSNLQLPGRCQCQNSFSVSRDRTCVPI
ncbi:unnamed protein product [Orchesella dallaii]|uniref:EGF-like domain-containing protein n=1 Tax=Orchesella dallaii TaxID=48710 RepID=A0ABP1PZ77_9HEXA